MTTEDLTSKTKVFVSYSRKDSQFTRRLYEALRGRGYDVDFDSADHDPTNVSAGISAQDEWWLRVKEQIAECDTMVFVVSPDSAASRVCDDEIAHARNLGKRVIAILRRAINFEFAPERLRALNVKLSFEGDADAAFEQAISKLCAEIDLDVHWYRQGSRLTTDAQLWNAHGRPEGELLPSGRISDAESWALRRPASAPDLGPLLLTFVEESRKKEQADRNRLLTALGRAFVKPAEQAIKNGRCDTALRLCAASVLVSDDLDMKLVPQRQRPLGAAAGLQTLRRVIHGHESYVHHVAVSPDGGRIVSGSSDDTARIWDAATGQQLACLVGHERLVRSAVFSPGGDRVLTASWDGTARVWSAHDGSELSRLAGAGGRGWCAAFSPDGSYLVFSSDGRAEDALNAAHGGMRDEDRVQIIETATGKEVVRFKNTDSRVWSCDFNADGTQVVGASPTGVHLWDAQTGRELARWKDGSMPYDAALNPTAQHVAAALTDGTIVVREVSSGRQLHRLEGHESAVRSVSYSHDGGRIASSSSDGSVRLWDAATGSEIACMRAHEGWVTSVAFALDDTRIFSAGDHTVRVWDCAPTRELARLAAPTLEPASVSFTEDGVILVSSRYGVRRYDASSGSELPRSPKDVGVPADTLRDAEAAKRVLEITGHSDAVKQAAFSPDGKRLASVSADGTLRMWNVASGDEVAHADVEHANTVTFSADGTMLGVACGASSADSKEDLPVAVVCEAEHLREIIRLYGHQSPVSSVAFDPNGPRVATTSGDRTIRLWDISHARALVGPAKIVLAASLSAGRGKLSPTDRKDFLMQSLPDEDDDLHQALMNRLSDAEREDVVRRAHILAQPLHRACYLAPSQRPGYAPKVQGKEPEMPKRPPRGQWALPLVASVAASVGVGIALLLVRMGLISP